MKLMDLAKVIRSKNAGALTLTLDVMFNEFAEYERVANSGVLQPALIATLYAVAPSDVQIINYPVANAIKITLPRTIPSGHPGDGDVYGAQQHAPLLDINIP